jgi:predicted transcriptional regulator
MILRAAQQQPEDSLSLTREKVAHLMFHSTSPYNVFVAEEVLDELWDLGVLCNMGEFHKYAYKLTDKGNEYLKKLLVYNKLSGVRR